MHDINLNVCVRIFELPEMAKIEILVFSGQPVRVRVISFTILYVNVVLEKLFKHIYSIRTFSDAKQKKHVFFKTIVHKNQFFYVFLLLFTI